MSRRIAIEYISDLEEVFEARNSGYDVYDGNEKVKVFFRLKDIHASIDPKHHEQWCNNMAKLHGWEPLVDEEYGIDDYEERILVIGFKRDCL